MLIANAPDPRMDRDTLADMLFDIMEAEFHTTLEDGSTDRVRVCSQRKCKCFISSSAHPCRPVCMQVAMLVVQMWKDVHSGNTAQVLSFVARTPARATVQHSAAADSDDDDDDDDAGGGEWESDELGDSADDEDGEDQAMMALEHGIDGLASSAEPADPDGEWETVPARGAPKKGKGGKRK